MKLPRKPTKAQNLEIPRGFQGSERALAAVVRAALYRAGYEVGYLGGAEHPSGLNIGMAGSTMSVGRVNNPSRFGLSDAQRCAEKLNEQLRAVSRMAGNLASTRRSATNIGSIPYAEVVVRCPNALVLRALYRNLVR